MVIVCNDGYKIVFDQKLCRHQTRIILFPDVDEITLNPEIYGRTQALDLGCFDVPMSETLRWSTPQYVG